MLLDLVLEVRRGDVLAARRDDDVLLAAGDLEIAVKDIRPPHQDLAVVGYLYLGAGERLSDRPEPEVLEGRDRRGGRGLGHPPALQDEHSGRVEETQDLGVDRRRAADGELEIAAEQAADRRQHLPVGDLVLLAQKQARLLALTCALTDL